MTGLVKCKNAMATIVAHTRELQELCTQGTYNCVSVSIKCLLLDNLVKRNNERLLLNVENPKYLII